MKIFQSCCRCWFCPWKKMVQSCHGSVLLPFEKILDRLDLYNLGLPSLITHHWFLPTSSLYTSPLFSRKSLSFFQPFTLSVFTHSFTLKYKLIGEHFKSILALPSHSHCTLHFPYLTWGTELGRNSGSCVNKHWNSGSRNSVHKGHTQTQRVHTLPVWEPPVYEIQTWKSCLGSYIFK